MLERFLERISLSEYRHNFILKGGMLISAMIGIDMRTTMDLDTAFKNEHLSESELVRMVEEILLIQIDDGVEFNFRSIVEIRDDADYPGYRITLGASFDKTRQALKLDISTGDVITPEETEFPFKLMLENREILILSYNIETVLAEKLETVITRATTNTRMRDFYDIYILTVTKKFDNNVFKTAFERTTIARGTNVLVGNAKKIIDTVERNEEILKLWKRYQSQYSYAINISWEMVMDAVKNLNNLINKQNEIKNVRGAKMDDNKACSNWILMHKSIAVAELEMLADIGGISKVIATFNVEHSPVGTVWKNQIDRFELNAWLKGRSIPANRENLEQLMRELNIINAQALALNSFALSLSDQYWLKPKDKDITWESVNFFQNEFSEDIGKMLVENEITENPDISSPDNTADGLLRKKWIVQNGKRVLIKGGNVYTGQEPFNEVVATKIMEKLGINHIAYTFGKIKGKPYSLCGNFIDENTELITAWRIFKALPKSESDSKFEHFIKCCNALGIIYDRRELDKMLVLDYIIANNGRHFGNFGFIRDAHTLEYLGLAPIYDNGHSLWHRGDDDLDEHASKTFEHFHAKQILLVEELSWFEPIPEQEVDEIIFGILSQNNRLSKEKIEMIAIGVKRNIAFINRLKAQKESND